MAASLGVSCNRGSWKGAGIQRGPEHGRRGIIIVRSRYHVTTTEDTAERNKLTVSSSELWK
jgi:hypothetical protein